MLKKVLVITLSVLTGAFYIFSGWSKLYPIEPFEFTFVDLGVSNWFLAPYIARSIIGVEFLLGVLFILNYRTRGFTSKASIFLLGFFTVYLLFVLIDKGNDASCGCFGEMIKMTPLESIIKNIFLALISFALLKFGVEIKLPKTVNRIVFAVLITASIAMPYILNYVDLAYSEAYLVKKENSSPIALDTLIVNATIKKVPGDIKRGKHIIAFLSATCPHCKIAASKLRIMYERDPSLPVLFVINGKKENRDNFFKATGSQNVEWCELNGKPFVYLAGTELPYIVLVNNGVVEAELSYMELNEKEIKNWLSK